MGGGGASIHSFFLHLESPLFDQNRNATRAAKGERRKRGGGVPPSTLHPASEERPELLSPLAVPWPAPAVAPRRAALQGAPLRKLPPFLWGGSATAPGLQFSASALRFGKRFRTSGKQELWTPLLDARCESSTELKQLLIIIKFINPKNYPHCLSLSRRVARYAASIVVPYILTRHEGALEAVFSGALLPLPFFFGQGSGRDPPPPPNKKG